MNPELKEKWLTALRSGDYKQGTGELRTVADNSYCCLGVLADVIDPQGWGDGDKTPDCFWRDSGGYLTSMIDELPESYQKHLYQLNDCSRLTFNRIADYIEANL